MASIPNNYTSEAKIYVDTQSLLRPLMKDLAVQPDIDSQLDIVRRTLFNLANIEKIIRKTDMDLTVAADPVARDKLIERMTTAIEMKVDRSNLFTFSYTAKTPQLAQKVVDTTLQIFVEMNLGNTQQDVQPGNSDRNVRSLEAEEARLKLLGSELEGATWQRNQLSVRLATVPKYLRVDEAPHTRAFLPAG